MSDVSKSLFGEAQSMFHPFMGVLNWKYKEVLPAFIHSASAAMTAYKLTRLLTEDDDKAEKAFYIGLFHDLYQKFGTTVEGLRDFLKSKVDDKDVLMAVNYNLAENPDLHQLGGAVWFGDMIQSSSTYTTDLIPLLRRASKLLNSGKELRTYFLSVYLPQLGTRSAIMERALQSFSDDLILVTGEGSLIITDREVEMPVVVDFRDVAIRDFVTDEGLASKPEGEKLQRDVRGEAEPLLSASTSSLFVNVRLEGVEWRDKGDRCLFCGLETPFKYPTQGYGYALYASASNERWNPKIRPLINLHSDVKKYPTCFYCNYDAAYLSKKTFSSREAKTFLQLHFTKPTPIEVIKGVGEVFGSNLAYGKLGDISLDEVIDLFRQWESPMEKVKLKGVSPPVIMDFSTATIVRDLGHYYEGGELKNFRGDLLDTFIGLMPSIGALLLLSQAYPSKITFVPDQVVERRVLFPARSLPLLDYDPSVREFTEMPLQTLLAMMSLRLADDKGKLDALRTDFRYTSVVLSSWEPELKQDIKSFKHNPKKFYKN